ncbi:MAG: head-tail connector protein [Betaproteobacteria bacterium]
MIDNLYRPMNPYYYSCWQYRWDRYASSGIKVVAEPLVEPVSVDDAAMHLRIDGYGSPLEYPEQSWIEATIVAAREVVEGLSGLALAQQTMELGIGQFPWGYYAASQISLRTSPVQWIESVIYTDSDGVEQTVDPANYSLDNYGRPALLYPSMNASWPTSGTVPNAVRVRFIAGYTLAGASPDDLPLPKSLRHAILLMIGHLYENRENTTALSLVEIPMGLEYLIERYKIRTGMA